MFSRDLDGRKGCGMPRRSHRKSRAGCSECKRRHIKCDEGRPACGNCSISSRHCSFLSSQPNLPIVGEGSARSLSPNLFLRQSDASTMSHSSPASPSGEFPVIQDANMTQLELFYHCINNDFDLPPASENPEKAFPPTILVETALSYPFLMNELLAFAALHLAHLNPARAHFYRHQAVGLQTNALSIFNCEMTGVNQENCTAVLFFNWFMTLHTLCETKDSADAQGFLDRFVHYMQLHRGVKAVTAAAWNHMLGSEMGYMLQEASRVMEHVDSGTHTVELKNCIDNSEGLSDEEKSICNDALDRIQWFLSRVDGMRDSPPSLVATFMPMISWSVIIDAQFLRLVSEMTPEALLILSYYAILLHMCRDIWVIGNIGQLLVQTVRLHLEDKWHIWLEWPEEMMNTMSSTYPVDELQHDDI
ncbi:hypothetical protein F4677DRAFT_295895 [Hypoxylon crocopeplum]|nr:hypothetical protein F4677DRAFT_295895 [Hypoxylon crocopeplum]